MRSDRHGLRDRMSPVKKFPAMPCEYCDGRVEERRVRDDHWAGDDLVIIEDVPVGVCNRCGERYYPARVLEKMDRIVARRSRIKRTVRVPVARFDTTA